MANSCQLVHKPYAEWLLAASAGRANPVASAMNAVTPLSTGKGEDARCGGPGGLLVVGRQEQSLMRATRAARAAALRAMPMKVGKEMEAAAREVEAAGTTARAAAEAMESP